MKPATSNVLIASIRRDGGTQIRAALDEGTVADYATAIKAKSQYELPDITVYFDGAAHWLSDGFHRVEAALRGGCTRISALVHKGTQRDAILAACGANAEHGLRRSNADKRRAVETLLSDPEWGTWSNRRIAKETQVSDVFVAECRERLRTATTEQSREVKPLGGANVCTGSASNSEPGQPTAGLAPPANPALEGDEDDDAADPRPSHNRAGSTTQAGAASSSSIDLLGIEGIDPAWMGLADDVGAALRAFYNHLGAAQGALFGAMANDAVSAQLQALRSDAHDLAARARKSVWPRSVCLYCKDPDGEQMRRRNCNGCRGLGWLTTEQLTAVPRELLVRGEAAKVIDQKAGGYVPRELAVERDDEDEMGGF